jgi:hypothetical protein
MTALVYHGPHGEPYYVADSAFGIARAAHAGAHGIDLNTRTCKRRRFGFGRVIVVTHWANWWEHGFKPKPGKRVPRKPIERLTLAQVRNLISEDGKHVILTAHEAALLCKIHGIIPFFEMKPSRWRLGVLRRLRVFCNARRIPFCVMTIQAYGRTARAKNRWEAKAYQRLWLAKQAGIKTVLLFRRHVDAERWGPVTDCIKGHRGFTYSGGHVLDLANFVRHLENK